MGWKKPRGLTSTSWRISPKHYWLILPIMRFVSICLSASPETLQIGGWSLSKRGRNGADRVAPQKWHLLGAPCQLRWPRGCGTLWLAMSFDLHYTGIALSCVQLTVDRDFA